MIASGLRKHALLNQTLRPVFEPMTSWTHGIQLATEFSILQHSFHEDDTIMPGGEDSLYVKFNAKDTSPFQSPNYLNSNVLDFCILSTNQPTTHRKKKKKITDYPINIRISLNSKHIATHYT